MSGIPGTRQWDGCLGAHRVKRLNQVLSKSSETPTKTPGTRPGWTEIESGFSENTNGFRKELQVDRHSPLTDRIYTLQKCPSDYFTLVRFEGRNRALEERNIDYRDSGRRHEHKWNFCLGATTGLLSDS